MIIKNGNVLHVNRFDNNADVKISNGKIISISHYDKLDNNNKIIDAEGCFVLPGLIDVHSHGLLDILLDEDSFIEYSKIQLSQGVTGCIATLGGSPKKNIETFKRALNETDSLKKTPNILGFRPEIMYLIDASAGNPDSITEISEEISEELYKESHGLIKIWDVSPELPKALDFIKWAHAKDIIVSMAHSNASIQQVKEATDAGMKLVTHFYDLFPIPTETDEGVYPAGVTDYINIEDRLTVELIPDGVHVHPLLIEKSLRCKGLDKIVFITDSVRGAGKKPGKYHGIYEGVQVEVTKDRGVRRVSDDILSGSTLTHLQGFRNGIEKFGLSIPDASKLFSRNQAKLLKLKNKGYLAAGMDADIIILDKNLNLKNTIVGGEITYQF